MSPLRTTEPVVGPTGDVAHPLTVSRSADYEPAVHEVAPDVFCAVGFGIANTTLVRGPEGCVIIDTGECREELNEVLDAFGPRLDRPIVGVVFTHSHYLWGTAALHDRGWSDLTIWGHEDIERVIADAGAEIAPAYQRRARLQFGYYLPETGPDSMSNVGLGRFFYRRGPKTGGYVAATDTVARHGTATTRLAGLRWEFAAYDSDSEDTIVIHLPELGVVINNHVWPSMFNIYPLRGEKYRDPLVLLDGLRHIAGLDPEHLVGAHGLPILGRENARQAVADHCDVVQYLWDQTVRGINAGKSPDQLAASITLPDRLASSRWIQQIYGEIPYYVRAVHDGLFGWFGTDTATLHPVAPRRRAELLVEGFGGVEAVLDACDAAVERGEHVWAAELLSHLLALEPTNETFRRRKAASLRHLSQRTPAANTRAHYLTEALSLEGACDPVADTPLVSPVGVVMRMGVVRSVHALRVQLDPALAATSDTVFEVLFRDVAADGPTQRAWLHVLCGVARYGTGAAPRVADLAVECAPLEWARLRARKVSVADADLVITAGTTARLAEFFALFEHGPR